MTSYEITRAFWTGRPVLGASKILSAPGPWWCYLVRHSDQLLLNEAQGYRELPTERCIPVKPICCNNRP
jgi:hypothetical protein